MATVVEFERDQGRIARLALAAQGGDRQAFGALFERFERQVFAIGLRRLGNFAEAQELCQDVFVQAMEKLDQLRTPECFGGWIASIAHRMAVNRAVRHLPMRGAEPGELEAARMDERTPLTNVLAGERNRRVRDGLARLTKLDRQTLEAFYVKGRSLKQMSGDFQAPVGTIKRRLHVARRRLAKEVGSWMAV